MDIHHTDSMATVRTAMTAGGASTITEIPYHRPRPADLADEEVSEGGSVAPAKGQRVGPARPHATAE